MFKFFSTLKNIINKYEKYIFYISIILSLFTLYLSLFDFFNEQMCCKSKTGQGFAILLKECIICPDINHYPNPIWYLFFATYVFCIVLYFGLKSLGIKYFFDKYLFATTLLTMSIAITFYTSFSYTKFYSYYYNVLFILIVLFGLINLIKNFNYYNKTYKKVIYISCLFAYYNLLFWSFVIFGFYRCVGGCL